MPTIPNRDINHKTQVVPGRVIDTDLSPSEQFAQTKLSVQGKLNVKTMGEAVAIPAPEPQPKIVGRSTKFKD